MPRLNIRKIQLENAKDMKRFERIGMRIFRKALMDQSTENPDPRIMENAYVQFYQEVFVYSAKKEYDRIRKQENQVKAFIPDEFFLATWRAWIGAWVKDNLGWMITRVNENTRTIIQSILAEAIEQGLNPFQTRRLIQEQVGGNRARALAIARTESTRANAMGKERSAEDWAMESGLEMWKIWVHGGSREPRPEHLAIQGKPIRKRDPFPLGGGMSKPGDPQGGPEQTINCSCTVVYVSERYIRRNYPELL